MIGDRERTRTVSAIRLRGSAEEIPDEVLVEKRVVLVVDGVEEALVVLTPGDEGFWALGHLRCRGLIASPEDVEDLKVGEERVEVFTRRRLRGVPLAQRFMHTASTGLHGEAKLEPLDVRWSVPASLVLEAVGRLAEGELFRRTGAVHVALVCHRGGSPSVMAEDVGRHNAVDKAVGRAMAEGLDLEDCFLAVSGRLPYDMVLKAAGARLPLLASVSATTLQGIEAARAWGITLVGFAREGRMNVYSHPERIEAKPRV